MGLSFAEFEALLTNNRKLQLKVEGIDKLLKSKSLAMWSFYDCGIRVTEKELGFYINSEMAKSLSEFYPGWAITYHKEHVTNGEAKTETTEYLLFKKAPAK